ncbi:MAG: ATP-binding protein [Planctomycetota bacterium JB042]
MISTGVAAEPLRILIVDSHSDFAESIADLARLQGLQPTCVSTLSDALGAMEVDDYDIAVIDQWLPDGRGIEFIAATRAANPDVITIVMSPFVSSEGTVEALTEGAFALLTKDGDAELALDTLRRARDNARLLKENRRLRATQDRILEAIPDQLLLIDPLLTVVGANVRRESFTLVHPPVSLPRPLAELLPPLAHDRLEWADLARRAIDGEEIERSLTLKEPTGRVRNYVVQFLPITGAAPDRLALIRIMDLTERIELERRLKESEGLAAVGRLTAIIAHEIRNPITGIRALAQLLRRDADGDDAESIDEILALTKRMSATLADLLQYARPPAWREERVPLADLVRDLVKEGRRWPACEGKTLEAVGTDATELAISGERDRLYSAFTNLIENALSMSPESGVVRVAISTEGTDAVVSIEDSGPGVDEEDRSQVFEPFFTRKSGGTGLGLSIVRTVIDSHGGRIEVGSSAALGGAAFRVLLPRISPAGGG